MPIIASKEDILAALEVAKNDVTTVSSALTEEQFLAEHGDTWSAANYLKHLIMSVKPFARALELPPEKMGKTFGQPENGSRTYDEVVSFYKDRLAEGLKAEMAPDFTPDNFRLPEDMGASLQTYLIETWQDGNERLLKNIGTWDEADLDQYQLPHPALGTLTLREMCFFTIYHNGLHGQDIKNSK